MPPAPSQVIAPTVPPIAIAPVVIETLPGLRSVQFMHLLTAIVFCALISAPLLVLVIWGPDQRYIGPALQLGLLQPYFQPRTQRSADESLTAELLWRSPLRIEAIGSKYRFARGLFNAVIGPGMVSGKEGWLFWKEEFWGGKCVEDSVWLSALNQMDLLEGLAKVAGTRLVFTIAPDKSTIYPEMLRPGFQSYSFCKTRNAARWRKLAKLRAPGLIDHTEVLEPKKSARTLLYFPTDTHWNLYAAAIATRQLVSTVLGIPLADLPAAELTGATSEYFTDMRRMLFIGGSDVNPVIDQQVEQRFVGKVRREGRNTMIVSDSFYTFNQELLEQIFFGSTHFYVNDPKGNTFVGLVRRKPSLLIVSSVERYLTSRFGGGSYGTHGSLGQAIIANNREAAEHCTFGPENLLDGPGPVKLFQVTRDRAAFQPQAAVVPSLFLAVPAKTAMGVRCVAIRIQVAHAAQLEIFLPPRQGRDQAIRYEAGRSIPVALMAGVNDIKVLLPEDHVGDEIRIDPVSDDQAFVIDAIRAGYIIAETHNNNHSQN